MAKENLVVHIQKLFLKKYTKNHKIIFIFIILQSKGEENNIRRAHTSTRPKSYHIIYNKSWT